MKKFLALAIMSILLLPNFTNARTHTIVEKDSYGTGLYDEGAISGNYVYVSNALMTVDVLDLSDTSNVTLFNKVETPCNVFHVATDDGILAAGCYDEINFYNVSDAANPVSVGSLDGFNGDIIDYTFEDNRLYLVTNFSEIIIYDTSDTENIVELSKIAIDSQSWIGLHKNGDFLYVVEGFDFARIYDVSDANNIQLVGEYETNVSQIFDVAVVSDTMYLSYSDGIQVIDISDRSIPTFIRNMTPTPDSGEFSIGWTLYSMDADLFLGTTTGEVVQFDLSDPHNPVDLTNYSMDNNLIGELVLFNNIVLTFSAHGGLSMADFSDSDNIIPLDGYNESTLPTAIAIENNRVVTTNQGGGYHLLELDDELGLSEATRIENISAGGAAALNGDTAWLRGNSGVETYDLTDYESPVQLDALAVDSTWANKVTKYDDDTLYIGNYNGEIFTYDVSSGFPVLISTISLGVDPETDRRRAIESIKPYGDFLLISTEVEDLVVVDLSDLNNPTELASYSWESGTNPQLEVVGNTLYLTKSTGLHLVDLTDITTPVFLSSHRQYGVLRAIVLVDGGRGVLVSGSDMYYLDTADETNPVQIHRYNSDNFLTSMAFYNGTIVTASLTKYAIQSFQLNSAPASSDSSVIAFANATFNGQLDSSDPEGDSVIFTIDTNVTNGTLVINDDGSFDYTPTTDFIGEDSFQYTAEDEHGGSSSATVSITVESGYDHVFNATVDTMFFGQVTETGLEGDEFKFKILVKPANGKIVFKSSGKFKYLANPGFIGEDTFEYAASNGTDFSENKTVKINVNLID